MFSSFSELKLEKKVNFALRKENEKCKMFEFLMKHKGGLKTASCALINLCNNENVQHEVVQEVKQL